MKTKLMLRPLALSALLLSTLIHQPSTSLAQGTAFTYNGRLNNNGAPVTGAYDLRFTLYDANAAGNVVAGPLLKGPVSVANGLFTVALDFGAGVFTGPARWLNIEVRPAGGGGFTLLSPRQEVTSSPYAIRAASAGTAADVSAGSVVKSLNTLKDNVTLAAGANVTITPNGNTLTLAAATGGGTSIWSVLNNNAYYNAANVGIGTATPGSRLVVAQANNHGVAEFVQGTPNTHNADVWWRGGTTPDWLFSKRTADGSGDFWFYRPNEAVMVLKQNGNVGIGSINPLGKLEVVGQDALRLVGYQPFLTLFDNNAGYARGRIQSVGGNLSFQNESYLGGDQFSIVVIKNPSGNVGIGTSDPQSKLEVIAQDAVKAVGYQPFFTLADANAGYARSRMQGVNGEISLQTEAYINGSAPNAYVHINSQGNISVASVTIRGGADLAEPFQMSSENIPKGAVVVIDSKNPGHLKMSDSPYDKRVAGIVSGANGINPGIALHQEGVLEGGENVALSGRVYVQADTTQGAIEPGDLLTTSSTPGHAMKVTDHAQAQGAILGKAMSALKDGKGMVLVLVTLQ